MILTQEQQDLYRRANTLYRAMFGGDTHAIDYFDIPVGSYQYNNDTVEINGITYQISKGLYTDWSAFNDVIHSLFTDQFWTSKNTFGDGLKLYTEFDGKMAFISATRGGGYYHRSDVPDEFELISISKDEIVFNLIGHYEVFPHNDEDVFYTAAFTIRMVRTEDGWRFDEFHDTLADEVSENDPRANFDAPGEKESLLPVYSNTMAGGYKDLYAVTQDGTLLMWGEREFTRGLRGGELGGAPVVLMKNVAAIYTSSRGAVLVVDREGSLWQFDVLETNPYTPVWIMDDVAMVSAEFMRTLILKQDGTLYEWEFSNRDSQQMVNIPEPVVYTTSSSYRCQAITTNGSLWEWNFGPEGFGPTKIDEQIDWTKYQYGLNEDGSILEQGITFPNVVQATTYWAVQEDGTLWHKGNAQIGTYPQIILSDVAQVAVSEQGILAQKSDSTYWYASFGSGFGSDVSTSLNFIRVY